MWSSKKKLEKLASKILIDYIKFWNIAEYIKNKRLNYYVPQAMICNCISNFHVGGQDFGGSFFKSVKLQQKYCRGKKSQYNKTCTYWIYRECVSTGAAGARTRRFLGHHFLHPLFLRLLVLCAPADFKVQSSLFSFYRTDCTRRFKFLFWTSLSSINLFSTIMCTIPVKEWPHLDHWPLN